MNPNPCTPQWVSPECGARPTLRLLRRRSPQHLIATVWNPLVQALNLALPRLHQPAQILPRSLRGVMIFGAGEISKITAGSSWATPNERTWIQLNSII